MENIREVTRELTPPGANFETFDRRLKDESLYPFTATGVSTLQINVGRLCNLACKHCHVEAGPTRTEVMSGETAAECLRVIAAERFETVDITGGAPEMNPSFRRLVEGAAAAGSRVIVRTNLTILLEPGYEDLPGFFRDHNVGVVASLPYFTASTADRMRGGGVFDRSVEVLKRLNSIGYGTEGGPRLNLVYNPCGAFFPPPQKSIEADFRRELARRYGVSFTELFTITNMPVGRFLKFLKRSGNFKSYLEKLAASYNPAAAGSAMCRTLVSVGWDGRLYDCDFNQMLGLGCGYGSPDHISRFDSARLGRRRIVTGPHCYGCAAGAGSSCTGEVA